MLQSDYHDEFHEDEFLVEETCIVVEGNGPYLHIRWYIEDPQPEAEWYVADYGSLPKSQLHRGGKVYMENNTSWIGMN